MIEKLDFASRGAVRDTLATPERISMGEALWAIQDKINEIIDQINSDKIPFYLKENQES